MRHPHRIPNSIGKRMRRYFLVFEHAKLLVAQRISGDAISGENSRVRCETGQNRRRGVVLSPGQDFDQRRPVWLLAQVWTLRFGSSDDYSIKPAIEKFVNTGVEIIQMPAAQIVARDIRQREEFQGNPGLGSGCT